jgi:NADPH-dependent curcumin reductase CurA
VSLLIVDINSDTASHGPKGLAGAIKKECPKGIDVFFDNGNDHQMLLLFYYR